jgi:hypothetical protein
LVITQPAGTGALAASFIENALLVQVLSQTANTATIRLGLTENLNMPPSQDLCVATTDTTVDWNDPAFTLGPGPFDLAGVGQLEGATLDGVLSNGGAWLEAHLFGEVPASSLTSLVGGDVCPVLSTFGGGCVPCTASVGDCLALESEGVAEEIVGFNLTQRTQQDIVADPGC